jgi:hypothetical protein
MNKRIRQLAVEAHAVGNTLYPYDSEFIEKFAELIIRECANITLDYKNHDHYYGWMDHGEEIIRHFGIER